MARKLANGEELTGAEPNPNPKFPNIVEISGFEPGPSD